MSIARDKILQETLKDFVAPGRLSNPFEGKKERPSDPKASSAPPVIQKQQTPVVVVRRDVPVATQVSSAKTIFGCKREWPYYISRNTEVILDKAIESGKLTEDDVPIVMRLALAVGNSLRRNVPTLTDLQIAIEFKNPERIRQVIAGEAEMTVLRHNEQNNSGIMNSRQLKLYWANLGQAVLQRLEPPKEDVK